MATISTAALATVNIILCSACRTSIVPNQKPDGGVVFGAALVHAVRPLKKRDLCVKYGYLPLATPATPTLTREERRHAKWAARDAANMATLKAQRDADHAALKAYFYALPEPNAAMLDEHDGKLEQREAANARLVADVGDELELAAH